MVKFRFVHHGSQTHGKGYMRTCGQCAVAMIAGCSLEVACEACGTRGATSYRHLRAGLDSLGFATGPRTIGSPGGAGTFLLRVRDRAGEVDHWAVRHGGEIYDSASGIFAEYSGEMRISSFCEVELKS